jgi:hypothetical protein
MMRDGTALPAIGDAQVDADGVVSGWCYSPARPEARVDVEILINEQVVASVVASRFLEDLRNRGIGDGYYGFSVTLTRQLNRMGDTGIVSLRERSSQFCFWHWVRGDFSLPAGFDDRLAAARARLTQLAGFVPTPPRPVLATVFAALGRHLSAPAAVAGGIAAQGRFSLVASARATGPVPPGAELVVFGNMMRGDAADGRRAHTHLQLPGRSFGAQCRLAMGRAQGRHLALCGQRLVTRRALDALPDGVVVSRRLGVALRRLIPGLMMGDLPAGSAGGVRLAAPRGLFEALGGLDPAFDEDNALAIADFALRAAAAGHAISLCDDGPDDDTDDDIADDMSDDMDDDMDHDAAAARLFIATWHPAYA